MLAWLAIEAELPDRVAVLLLDALRAWQPLRGPHVFPVEPKAGPDCDLQQLLENMWWQLGERAAQAPWPDSVVLTEVVGRLGLALAAWRCRLWTSDGLRRPQRDGPVRPADDGRA